MTAKSLQERSLLGLLECPFRKGYIEFEYRLGDTIGQLRKTVGSVWGAATALGGELDHDNWHGGLSDRGVWAILGEDESGAYLTLSDHSVIPAHPPKASNSVRSPHISPNRSQQWNLPSGLIYDDDVAETFLREPSPNYDGSGRHLSLGFNRDYEVPKDKEYAVKLVALIVITGG